MQLRPLSHMMRLLKAFVMKILRNEQLIVHWSSFVTILQKYLINSKLSIEIDTEGIINFNNIIPLLQRKIGQRACLFQNN